MRIESLSLASTLALSLLCAPAAAQSVTYELTGASGYTEGCYPPCTCPIWLADSLTGGFVLTFQSVTPDFYEHYAVSDLAFEIQTGGQSIDVTGSGQYDVGGHLIVMQRLQLDLSFGGAPPTHFDSGSTIGGSGFPDLDVAVSEHGMVCYDRVFDLHAVRALVGSSYCVASPNSVGAGARIGASGSASVAEADFALFCEHAVPGQFGIFFFGPQMTQVPFGDGTLCVTGGSVRLLPPLLAGPNGGVSRAIDFTLPPAAGRLVPGSSWNFQFWYRDPTGGPSGFNLSDGLHVTFH